MSRPLLPALLTAVPLLSGCVYFNTFYNAQKAYDQAERLHDRRLEKNPEDSALVTTEEKDKLDRAITKASKVLELYPANKKYPPKSLFLIGESYLMMGEYAKAVEKYEELQRFYPNAPDLRMAQFHRAKALFLSGQYTFARPALEQVAASTGDLKIRREVMTYLAQMQVKNDSALLALDMYERLLAEGGHSKEERAGLHWEAAKLAFSMKQWEKAMQHARARETSKLPIRVRYRCDMLVVDCLFQLGRVPDGLVELRRLRKDNLYLAFVPEIDLKQAEGLMILGKTDKALALLRQIPRMAPHTAYSAEAFYRLGEYQLRALLDEKQAKVFFDSAAASGTQFEFGLKGSERSQALTKLAELRRPDTSKADKDLPTQYKNFMIAELFLFRLESVDSSLKRLDRIVADPRQDSAYTMRAAYARAFITDEFKHDSASADSLYRYVLAKYPNTEYAKQAERNLGLRAGVKTDEDRAHQLFLAAEALRFDGEPVRVVIPAYKKVVEDYENTREAAKAQFVIAMLYEKPGYGLEREPNGLDSAKSAYLAIREHYFGTPYYAIADAKLTAAGVKQRGSKKASVTAPAKAGASAVTPEKPAVSPETPPESSNTVPAVDSTASQPDENPVEKLENDY